MSLRIAVVTAGLSNPSSTRLLADQLAASAVSALADVGASAELDVVELRPLAHALADRLLTGFPTGDLSTAIAKVVTADALIVVSPIFSASYSGLFKMFFDVLEPEALAGVPVVLAATAGSARHSLVLEHAMRPLFSYLKTTPTPTAVFAASEDFGDTDGGALTVRIERAARELAALVSGVGGRATPRGRSLEEQFADPTPFAELLGRT
ncbi:FMN reductase [Nocardioides gilvus]|uniref:FMN reductase n=1 Tax=Nocardioides gilvus TaxID=1735589 RepID=UPI000D74A10B|nr:FMN reductase [Nocardioides gilvus]